MTPPPHRFRTHDRGLTNFVRKIEKPLDPFAELLCLHVIGVAAK